MKEAVLALAFACVASFALAQEIKVSHDGSQGRTITEQQLRALPRQRITTTLRNKQTSYEGVLLLDVLRAAGFDVKEPVAAETLITYVVAVGADGYRALLALPEAVASFSGKQVLLADTADGKPLPRNGAPWQLIIPGDQRPTRWVRQLVTLEVHRAPRSQ